MARRLSRGEVHLLRYAPPDKRRPVLILTRQRALGHLSTATIAPNTSSIRGVPSEVILAVDDGMKGPCAVNLYNMTTVQQADLGPRLASLSADRMREICASVRFSLGCD